MAAGAGRTVARPTLLEQVAAAAVEDPYAAAARARAGAAGGSHQAARSRSGRRIGTVLAAGLAGLLVALGATAEARGAAGLVAQRDRLAAEAATRQRLVAALDQQRSELDRQVGQLGRDAAAAAAAAAAAGAELARQQQAAGLVSVSGPALQVTLADSTAYTSPQPGQGKITDADVQQVVSALWQSGAEAVAVSGQRLGPRSAIRTAGRSILVNFVALTPPYQVVAVGDPLGLQARFAGTGAAARLRTAQALYGVRMTTSRLDAARLPAGSVDLPAVATPAPG